MFATFQTHVTFPKTLSCLKCLTSIAADNSWDTTNGKMALSSPAFPMCTGHKCTSVPPSQGKYLFFYKRNFKTLVFSQFHLTSPVFPAQDGWLPPLWSSCGAFHRAEMGLQFPGSSSALPLTWISRSLSRLLSWPPQQSGAVARHRRGVWDTSLNYCSQRHFFFFKRINNNSCSAIINNPTIINQPSVPF